MTRSADSTDGDTKQNDLFDSCAVTGKTRHSGRSTPDLTPTLHLPTNPSWSNINLFQLRPVLTSKTRRNQGDSPV